MPDTYTIDGWEDLEETYQSAEEGDELDIRTSEGIMVVTVVEKRPEP